MSWTEQDLADWERRQRSGVPDVMAALRRRADSVDRRGRNAAYTNRKRGVPNKTEAAFGEWLKVQYPGAIIGFEAITLRLADGARYTPDYFVAMRLANGAWRMECFEVKGRKGTGYYCTEAGKLRIKFAAERFKQFSFTIVWPLGGGGWGEERVG